MPTAQELKAGHLVAAKENNVLVIFGLVYITCSLVEECFGSERLYSILL